MSPCISHTHALHEKETAICQLKTMPIFFTKKNKKRYHFAKLLLESSSTAAEVQPKNQQCCHESRFRGRNPA